MIFSKQMRRKQTNKVPVIARVLNLRQYCFKKQHFTQYEPDTFYFKAKQNFKHTKVKYVKDR